MGKRGQRPTQQKKQASGGMDPVLEAALAAGGFKALPPNKRHDLNKIVEKLLNLCSNFAKDAPTTPQGLFEEHMEIRDLLTKILELEQCNLNRRLMGSRKIHAKNLLEWIEKFGGTVKGVVVEESKDQGLGLKVTPLENFLDHALVEQNSFFQVKEDLKQGDVVMEIPRKCM